MTLYELGEMMISQMAGAGGTSAGRTRLKAGAPHPLRRGARDYNRRDLATMEVSIRPSIVVQNTEAEALRTLRLPA